MEKQTQLQNANSLPEGVTNSKIFRQKAEKQINLLFNDILTDKIMAILSFCLNLK
ncbi:MAG: hypothetical protein AAF985_24185 [Bacteroidota bacterium]